MIALLLDTVALVIVAIGTYWGVDAAVEPATLSASVGEEGMRTATEIRSIARIAYGQWLIGAALLVVGRGISSNRRGRPLMLPGILPALLSLLGIGVCVQMAYGNAVDPDLLWPGPAFAQGCLWACVAGFAVLAWPGSTHRLLERLPGRGGTAILTAAIGFIFVALLFFGTAPGASDAKINLGPVQPLELVKLLFVLLLAIVLGDRSAQLRFQRLRKGWLRLPKPRHLQVALCVLFAIVLLLFSVKDLGIVLILSVVFLALFYVVTGASGWVFVAIGVVCATLAALAFEPTWAPGGVEKRIVMWLDPWLNGRSGGDQLAQSLWAISSGGVWGLGLGEGLGSLPAGHNDLIIAHLAEELGLVGVCAYLFGLATVVCSGFWVSAHCRTPRSNLLAAGLSLLLAVQWAVIFAGTFGLLPLTGVVVPFLSAGKSSMITFVVVVAWLIRLAEGGAAEAERTDELDHLRHGVAYTGAVTLGVFGLGALAAFFNGVVIATETAARPTITYLRDPEPPRRQYWLLRFNERLVAVAARVPRGPILDRNGETLAGIDEQGRRTYPLGDGLGALLTPTDRRILLPDWSLEGRHEAHLRGYPDLADPPGKWVAANQTWRPMVLGVAGASEADASQALALALARDRFGPDVTVEFVGFTAPDYRSLVSLMRASPEQREKRLAQLAADPEPRTVRLTLDARLQMAASEAVKEAAKNGQSASAVVLDGATGEVLARAQWPDFDPGGEEWEALRRSNDPVFTGEYGAWQDKTGFRGVYQAGSVGKVFTAMAAVRSGAPQTGKACKAVGLEKFSCSLLEDGLPGVLLPDWTQPIHDHGRSAHGDIEMVNALAVSCNAYFGQLALSLGPEPLQALVADGLEVRWRGDEIDPGPMGSRKLAETGFGQGALALSPMQAARMIAAAGDGQYRFCDPGHRLGEDCQHRELFSDPDLLAPVMAGMRKVVDAGTARAMPELAGVRVYGKTGTADDPVRTSERIYGVVKARPHSWFVALAEPAEGGGCAADNAGRLAVAVVATRAGYGSQVAMPAARAIIGAANGLGYFGETKAAP